MRKSARVYTERSRSGFTLIELLVVVAIIAVLSVIGITIFTGVQKNARDARRKADIDSIGKAMEVNYDKLYPGQYAALCQVGLTGTVYDCAKWFSSGQVPVDPSSGGTTCQTGLCKYCIKSSPGNCGTGDTTVSSSSPVVGTSYVVCTNLEQGTPSYYCASNQQ